MIMIPEDKYKYTKSCKILIVPPTPTPKYKSKVKLLEVGDSVSDNPQPPDLTSVLWH